MQSPRRDSMAFFKDFMRSRQRLHIGHFFTQAIQHRSCQTYSNQTHKQTKRIIGFIADIDDSLGRLSFGQEKDNLPLKSYVFPEADVSNKTSAIPPASVPGSQAATKASDTFSSGFTHKVDGQIKTRETVGIPAALNVRSCARWFSFFCLEIHVF